MPVCTTNLKMTSADKLDVTVPPPNANGDPPTVVPTEPLHVEDLGSSYPVKV